MRASRSVTNNIAEGYGRFHFQENIQFNRHSRGSLHEVIDHTIIAKDEGYISEEEYKNFRELLNRNLAVLNGYINYLVNQKKRYETKE
jgi:four helix bundle protein